MTSSTPKFVVRVKAFDGRDQSKRVIAYLNSDGSCSQDARRAMRYDSEADAWLHATSTGNIGSDKEGDWCWVEPAPS